MPSRRQLLLAIDVGESTQGDATGPVLVLLVLGASLHIATDFSPSCLLGLRDASHLMIKGKVKGFLDGPCTSPASVGTPDPLCLVPEVIVIKLSFVNHSAMESPDNSQRWELDDRRSDRILTASLCGSASQATCCHIPTRENLANQIKSNANPDAASVIVRHAQTTFNQVQGRCFQRSKPSPRPKMLVAPTSQHNTLNQTAGCCPPSPQRTENNQARIPPLETQLGCRSDQLC